MGFLYPELLLLAVPMLAVWWSLGTHRPQQGLRLVLLMVTVLAMAGPVLQRVSRGQDVIVVVDGSRSMPQDTNERALELIALLEEQRGRGDRVGVVRFGRTPVLEQALSEGDRFAGFSKTIEPDGSDVAAALAHASALIPNGRAGRILLVSDGETDATALRIAAQQAAARGISIHTRALRRPIEADLSVVQLDVPGRVPAGAPFQFSAWVHASTSQTTPYVLKRDGVIISEGTTDVVPGMNRLVFRDIREQVGVAEYTLHLEGSDRIPENNTGKGAVAVEGARSILVLNDNGQPDALTRALQSAGLEITVRSPEQASLTAVGLTAHRAVVLENVAASRLGEGMTALEDFVIRSGGGLLMTGGEASFGVGGFHASPIENLLPVTLEMREEHRKMGMALAVVMDRSGSMAATTPSGSTKMTLANQGAAAALNLMSPIDAATVIAVDTLPQVVIPLSTLDQPGNLIPQILGIKSGGGGIYTRVALEAAQQELQGAEQQNRHIILFADASDAEQSEGVPELLSQLQSQNITTSVIALGTNTDPDAAFLTRVAEQGGGQIYFTTRPQDLPRLFAMDTLVMSKATMVEEPTATVGRPGLQGMIPWTGSSFPTIDGYNLTYLRPEASMGIQTADEHAAPLFAFHQRGLGKAAAFTGQIGGRLGQRVLQWPDVARFFVSVVRSLSAADPPQSWYANTRMDGSTAVIAVEGPGNAAPVALLHTDGGTDQTVPLTRVSETRWEARVPLHSDAVTLGTVQVGEDQHLPLPPMSLTVSPEFAYNPDPARGERQLRMLATMSGGRHNATINTLLDGDRSGVGSQVLTKAFAGLALLLLLLEITMRRLQLWSWMPALPSLSLPSIPRRQRATSPRSRPAPPAADPTPTAPTPPSAPEPTAPAEPEDDLAAALRTAREQADRRMRR